MVAFFSWSVHKEKNFFLEVGHLVIKKLTHAQLVVVGLRNHHPESISTCL